MSTTALSNTIDAVTKPIAPVFQLYTHATPNGDKIAIALEELGFSYAYELVDIRTGEQHAREIVAMNPNAKIPILKDLRTAAVISESSAILLYLAETSGRLFPPREDAKAWYEGIEKLFFASASIGPMFGQRMHFSFLASETVPYGIERYEREGERLNAVMERMLEDRPYFLQGGYSIVDIAVFGWAYTAKLAGHGFGEHSKLEAWHRRVAERPAVQKGLTVPMPRDASRMPPHKMRAAA